MCHDKPTRVSCHFGKLQRRNLLHRGRCAVTRHRIDHRSGRSDGSDLDQAIVRKRLTIRQSDSCLLSVLRIVLQVPRFQSGGFNARDFQTRRNSSDDFVD